MNLIESHLIAQYLRMYFLSAVSEQSQINSEQLPSSLRQNVFCFNRGLMVAIHFLLKFYLNIIQS